MGQVYRKTSLTSWFWFYASRFPTNVFDFLLLKKRRQVHKYQVNAQLARKAFCRLVAMASLRFNAFQKGFVQVRRAAFCLGKWWALESALVVVDIIDVGILLVRFAVLSVASSVIFAGLMATPAVPNKVKFRPVGGGPSPGLNSNSCPQFEKELTSFTSARGVSEAEQTRSSLPHYETAETEQAQLRRSTSYAPPDTANQSDKVTNWFSENESRSENEPWQFMSLLSFKTSIRSMRLPELKKVCKLAQIKISSRESKRDVIYALYSGYRYEARRAEEWNDSSRLDKFGSIHSLLTTPQKKKKVSHKSTQRVRDALQKLNCTAHADAAQALDFAFAPDVSWPDHPSEAVDKVCKDNFFQATCYQPPLGPCAVCACVPSPTPTLTPEANMLPVIPFTERAARLPNLGLLRASAALFEKQGVTSTIMQESLMSQLQYTDSTLNGLILDSAGLVYADESEFAGIRICDLCNNGLGSAASMPPLALANFLFRGSLPEEFQDLTWIEEQMCAIYSCYNRIVRVYSTGAPEKSNWKLKGNICAAPQNLVSLLTHLPPTPTTLAGMISVAFVGTHMPDRVKMSGIFLVRKKKVWRFLIWLQQNNRLYADLTLSQENMAMYADDDGMPQELFEVMTKHVDPYAADLRSEETAGLQEHPSELVDGAGSDDEEVDSDDGEDFFIEQTGLIDTEQTTIPARFKTASALRNLCFQGASLQADANGTAIPDLRIPSGRPVGEYNNNDLLPGLFPSLYPFGIGGADHSQRPTTLSFERQVEKSLRHHSRAFSYHHAYKFVTLNIIQRHTVHRATAYHSSLGNFPASAKKLTEIAGNKALVDAVAAHFEQEGSYATLTSEQKEVVKLVNKLQTIGMKVPGSDAAKRSLRSDMRSYMGYFGIPSLFLTLNFSPAHSPIFQVMIGNVEIDLSSHLPELMSGPDRARAMAKDPVAAADFYDFMVEAVFKYLLGWDKTSRTSNNEGGLFGKLRAYYGASEYTERGCLHGHFLIWLEGAPNPSDLHARLRNVKAYDKSLFRFIDHIIAHDLPDVPNFSRQKRHDCRVERPYDPSSDDYATVFPQELKISGEELQRHVCKKVCHKYGHKHDCRFQFPHDIVPDSYFDAESNSIYIKCRDSMVNWHNPTILVLGRFNHDLKFILSGKAAKAAAIYISNYMAKGELKMGTAVSLINRAVLCMPKGELGSLEDVAHKLMNKILAKFASQQSIHAQQAARYLQGYTDSIQSHPLSPLLAGAMQGFLTQQFGQLTEPTSTETSETSLNEAPASNAQTHVKLKRTDDGIQQSTSVQDYLFRGEELADLMFFFSSATLTKVKKVKRTSAREPRTDRYIRAPLLAPHPEADKMELVYNPRVDRKTLEIVPKLIGCNIPRSNGPSREYYCHFMLMCFRPFSATNPLKLAEETWEAAFDREDFDLLAVKIMQNWTSIDECEDERDKERLRKRAKLEQQDRMGGAGMQPDGWDLASGDAEGMSAGEVHAQNLVGKAHGSGWLNEPSSKTAQYDVHVAPTSLQNLDNVTSQMVKTWKQEIKTQEDKIKAQRRQLSRPGEQQNTGESENEGPRDVATADVAGTAPSGLPEVEPNSKRTETKDVESILKDIEVEDSLNYLQKIAFRLCATHFVEQFVRSQRVNDPVEETPVPDPLRLLLMGPGGTGKTHIVKSVKKVMAHFQCEHQIRFAAYTGTAASLIDGETLHSSLKLKIHRTKGQRSGTSGDQQDADLVVELTEDKADELRDEWRCVQFLLIDEVSMNVPSAELSFRFNQRFQLRVMGLRGKV
ncbi:hypothetical protein P7C70_g3507, partial [Phenoliferia sp. Uapishka_3]